MRKTEVQKAIDNLTEKIESLVQARQALQDVQKQKPMARKPRVQPKGEAA